MNGREERGERDWRDAKLVGFPLRASTAITNGHPSSLVSSLWKGTYVGLRAAVERGPSEGARCASTEDHQALSPLHRFHLMLQPTLARWLLSTGFPASTASIAARRSRPLTGLLLPGRLSSS
jgi:hypothetical protein